MLVAACAVVFFAAAFVGGFLIWQRSAGPSWHAHAPHAPSASRPVRGPFTTTATSPLYRLEVDIAPGMSGINTLHLYAYTPAGASLKVAEWRASAAQQGRGVQPFDIRLVALTESHAIGEVNLPDVGIWTFSFTLRTRDVDTGTVRITVPIT
ncbi:MAG: hypothetical protein J2P15_04590 [Micromonosporaceae bacterium]|nr:hypothetical protein [Micromonosporaceae bacterium]